MRRAYKLPVVLGLGAMILALIGGPHATPVSRAQSSVIAIYQSEPVKPHIFNGDLRDVPPLMISRPALQWTPALGYPIRVSPRSAAPAVEPNLLVEETSGGEQGFVPPPLLPSRNFAGIGFRGVTPADPVGDVGPQHYIQATNNAFSTRIRIYDKARPAPNLLLATTLADIWAAAGGDPASLCGRWGLGDPIVLWDSLANRWFLSELALDFNTFADWGVCIYVSQGTDPITGGWHIYEFHTPDFPDYPKYGVWPGAYFMGANEAGGPGVYAFERSAMLAGNPASFQHATLPRLDGFGFQMLIPADVDGQTPPPAGSPGLFMRHVDTESHPFYSAGVHAGGLDFVELWEFAPDFANLANSTIGGPIVIPIGEFDSNLCGLFSFSCIPKPGGTPLDPLREVVMWRLAYRSFGGDQRLVGNFATDVTGADHAGIRWFELQNTGGGWIHYQHGTWTGPGESFDGLSRWMGSIAQDRMGNIALGYSISSATVFPGMRYTARMVTDPPGTMTLGEAEMVLGESSNDALTPADMRWGDYSSLNVDPVDGCTFWYTNMYGADGVWKTQIGTFHLSTCPSAETPPAQPAVSDFDPAIGKIGQLRAGDLGLPGEPITWTIRVTNQGTASAHDVIVTDTLVPELRIDSVSASKGSFSISGQTVTFSPGTLAPGETVTLEIVTTVIGSPPNGLIVNTATVAGGGVSESASASVQVVSFLPQTGYPPGE